MKKKYLTAREVIGLFRSELNFTMSEANFAKHKKAEVFKKYKVEGKKGDFYLWPEAAVDFFDVVSQNKEMGWNAIQKLARIVEAHKREQAILNRIDVAWGVLWSLPKLERAMFDTDQLDDEYKANGFALFEEGLQSNMSDNILLRDFVCSGLDDELHNHFPNYGGHEMRALILEEAASWIMTPEKVAESHAIDLLPMCYNNT